MEPHWIIAILVAPWLIALIVAMVRGYNVHFTRHRIEEREKDKHEEL